jgi:hypothetical protein
MTRYRITVHGIGVQLRGYIDGGDQLNRFAKALATMHPQDPTIVASPAEPDHDPFRYELVKAAEVVIAAYDDRYGRVDGAAWVGPNLDAAIERLRQVR